jgi:3-oxoacyl-[acyl-carrier-protein] synthase II
MSARRAVITGLGVVSPLGCEVGAAWDGVIAGKSGVGAIDRFDAAGFPSRIAAEVRDFDPAKYFAPKEARHMDSFIHYGMAAGIDAVGDAGIGDGEADPERIGVSIGSGIGGLPMIERVRDLYRESGARKISPFFVPATIINMISGNLSIRYGFEGPNFGIVSACTTATHCIGNSLRLIQCGDADVMICGGAEAAISPLAVGGFGKAGALSARNDEPEKASRPWDKDRDGFVLGEGAGVVVLEEYERAKKRGANIYAELAGYGVSADAHHITAPREDGRAVVRCMAAAMRDAELPLDAADYINAHATSTPLGDLAETRAIHTCFGAHAGKLLVSSTKSMIGHLLGAAGGVEAVFTILGVARGVAAPTINLDSPGEGCDLDFVANEARDASIGAALSNSFGFGGTNATLVFRRV